METVKIAGETCILRFGNSVHLDSNPLFTVFTATYNRASCIERVYRSLRNQTFDSFEWVIVDDGSTDDTESVIKSFAEKADFPIRYIRIEHGGKPAAWNVGITVAYGQLFVSADSDDAFVPESLYQLNQMWVSIPENKRFQFRGVSCRCIDSNGNLIGNNSIPTPYLDCNSPDAVFKHGINYELWGANRTDVLREFPFPRVEGLKFYPEIIIWDSMSEKYKSRFFNQPLREVYDDQDNKTTSKKGNQRFKENYYLWKHYLNDLTNYFKYNPLLFVKSAVGIVRDGHLAGISWTHIIKEIYPLGFKLIAIGATPFALLLAKTGK